VGKTSEGRDKKMSRVEYCDLQKQVGW
jgi:hypothetical protein